jgi:retron-type reverse transcriptase
MTDKVFKAMDSKELTVIVLLDLSKAFDSIDHRKLLTKLKAKRPKPWRLRMVQKLLDRKDAAGEDWLSCVRTQRRLDTVRKG